MTKCEICGGDESICPILRGETLYGAPSDYNTITLPKTTSKDKETKELSLYS